MTESRTLCSYAQFPAVNKLTRLTKESRNTVNGSGSGSYGFIGWRALTPQSHHFAFSQNSLDNKLLFSIFLLEATMLTKRTEILLLLI